MTVIEKKLLLEIMFLYELILLDRNTRNYRNLCKLFVLDRNTYHLTVKITFKKQLYKKTSQMGM